VIYDNVDIDANIIFGALVDDRVTNGEVISYFDRCMCPSDEPSISIPLSFITTMQVSITVLATGFATDFFAVEGGEDYNAPIPKSVKPVEKVEKTDSSWRREAVMAREGPIVVSPPIPSSAKRPRPKLEEDIGGFEVIDRRAITDSTLDIDEDEDKLRNRRRRIQQSGQSEKNVATGRKGGGIRGFFRRLFGG